ncbi:MAG: hypothetical protein JNK82_42405 [Myxococcaceae bacterium]|nr:hypothetical protein [Myxococcaceae bacterium]
MLPRVLAASIALAVCSKKTDLRGFDERTPDGGTLLVVDDDSGGGCPLTVDGRPVKAHRPIAVKPGRHTVACGSGNDFDVTVRAGHTYHFDYWGP